jgi:hypothetical protein
MTPMGLRLDASVAVVIAAMLLAAGCGRQETPVETIRPVQLTRVVLGGGTDAAVFLIGEFVKVASTIALLALVIAVYKDLVWLAMLISIIAVLKSYVLALLIR